MRAKLDQSIHEDALARSFVDEFVSKRANFRLPCLMTALCALGGLAPASEPAGSEAPLQDAASASLKGDKPELEAPQQTNFLVLDLVVDPGLFERIGQRLELSPEQKAFCTNEFAGYWQRVRQLDQRARTEVLDAGLQKLEELRAQQLERRMANRPKAGLREDQVEAHESELPSDEELELERSAFVASARARRSADSLLAELFAQMQPVLTDSQAAGLPSVSQMVRLHNFFQRPASATRTDFAEHPDLRLLMKDLIGSAAEIDALPAADVDRVRTQLQQIMLGYEAALDDALKELFAQLRDASPPTDYGHPHVLGQTDPSTRRAFRKAGSRWARVYEVNRSFADKIQLCVGPDTSVAARFNESFLQAYAPHLMQRECADAIKAMLQDLVAPESDAWRFIGARLAQYFNERSQLRKEAFDVAAKQMRKYGNLNYPLDDQDRERSLKKLVRLQETLLSDLRTVLPPDQQARFDQHVSTRKRDPQIGFLQP
ncbi:MAG: hypothetical protein L0Z53_12850 [Acidobacteriales bacterium]|nr:hypothetical protein [Terriglobales bacterium]